MKDITREVLEKRIDEMKALKKDGLDDIIRMAQLCILQDVLNEALRKELLQ